MFQGWTLTASPRFPGLPAGPDGPTGPEAPAIPRGPGDPGSPRSPCQFETVQLNISHGFTNPADKNLNKCL